MGLDLPLGEQTQPAWSCSRSGHPLLTRAFSFTVIWSKRQLEVMKSQQYILSSRLRTSHTSYGLTKNFMEVLFFFLLSDSRAIQSYLTCFICPLISLLSKCPWGHYAIFIRVSYDYLTEITVSLSWKNGYVRGKNNRLVVSYCDFFQLV